MTKHKVKTGWKEMDIDNQPKKIPIGSDKLPQFKKSAQQIARDKLELEIGNEVVLLIRALRIFLEKNSTRTVI